jgi:hypothetical protein
VLRNILRSRRARAQLARRLPSIDKPVPGSVQVAVYFADTRVNLYQIRQWYAPLAELAKTRSVAIIARSPGTMLTLLDESPVPVVYLRKVVELEDFVESQNIKIVFYVNQNTKNFQMFRYGRMWHVFINHGESDKMYMTTNQFKAYDYSFIAGEAARERLARKLWDFDLDRRAIQIGRPQADHFAGVLPYPDDDRTVVLYAPTWEGDRESAAYGSIATHGVPLVEALLATGAHRVVYRPHPRSGVLDPAYRAANESIIAAIAAANASDPAAHHIFDDGPQLDWQLAGADVAITDVLPWSTTGSRPVSRSSSPARRRRAPTSTRPATSVIASGSPSRTPATSSTSSTACSTARRRARSSTSGSNATSATRHPAPRRHDSTVRSSGSSPSGSTTRRSTRPTSAGARLTRSTTMTTRTRSATTTDRWSGPTVRS